MSSKKIDQHKTKKQKGQVVKENDDFLKTSSPSKGASNQEFQSILASFWHGYSTQTPKKIKIMDSFCFYCFLLVLIQIAYFIIVGTYPLNSFVAGLIAPSGCAFITICLRLQLNPDTKYMTMSSERAFWEYFVTVYLLLVVCVNYVG